MLSCWNREAVPARSALQFCSMCGLIYWPKLHLQQQALDNLDFLIYKLKKEGKHG
jgi:hypothetical protein